MRMHGLFAHVCAPLATLPGTLPPSVVNDLKGGNDEHEREEGP